jgi:hypothetical protein
MTYYREVPLTQDSKPEMKPSLEAYYVQQQLPTTWAFENVFSILSLIVHRTKV